MPRPLEPNQRFPLWLAHDADQTPRPTFYFKSASYRRYLAVCRAAEAAETGRLEIMHDFLVEQLVDWEHMIDPETTKPIDFDPEKFGDLVEVHDVVELFWGFNLGREDKKKSESSP